MVLQKLIEANAYLEGHFLLSSGKHSNRYCQCAKLFEQPQIAKEVISIVADKMKDLEFDLIVGPAMGGVIAAYELAAQTGKPNVFAERENNIMCFRRGFFINAGQRVVIMEDVITTGKSTLEVAELVKSSGGIVVAAGCVVNRSDNSLPFPIFSATELEIETYESDNCPLCKQNIPVVKPGSRKF